MQKRIVLIVLGVMSNVQAAERSITGGSDMVSSSELVDQRPPAYAATLGLSSDQLRAQAHEQSKGDMIEAYFALCRAGQMYLTTLDPETVKQAAQTGVGILGVAAITNTVAETPILSEMMALIGCYNIYSGIGSESKKLGLTDNLVIASTGLFAPVVRFGICAGMLAAACETVRKIGLESEKVYIATGVFLSVRAVCRRIVS